MLAPRGGASAGKDNKKGESMSEVICYVLMAVLVLAAWLEVKHG